MNPSLIASAISGLVWGIIGSSLFWMHSGRVSSIYFYAAPFGVLVGLSVYFLFRWSYRKSFIWILPIAVISTYIAVAIFGLGLGVADLVRYPNRIPYAVILQASVACLWGITFIPIYWSLFGLSMLNHAIIRYFTLKAEQGAAANP
jgi:hypothetical protein